MSNENVCRFEKLLQGVKREGVEELLNFIRGSDFYTTPASTRYHLAEEGGLLKHSLHVYDCLMKKKENPVWKEVLSDVSDDTFILVSLLHDLCKTYFYGEELKNRKTYDEEKVKAANPRTVKRDANGEFIWETVPAYVVDDKYPLGHGEKSVFFIMQFVKLTMLEIAAIKHHMGSYCDSSQWNTSGKRMKNILWHWHFTNQILRRHTY